MLMRNPILVACLVLICFHTEAQTGGNTTYSFLNLNSAARVAALGGNQIAVKDQDLNLGFYNPSLLDSGVDGQLALSYINYFTDINYGFASYAKHYKGVGTFAATLNYLDYGDFILADETGQQLGTFSAGDYALTMGYGRQMDSLFSVGGNLKFIYSSLEQYSSFGIAADISGTYYNQSRKLVLAAVMKNMGAQLKTYVPDVRESLPFEIQLGITKELKHAPLRIGLIAENLQKWNLTGPESEDVVEIDPLTGLAVENKQWGFGDRLMRHMVVNGEILLSKNFNVRIGYNYRRRQELKLNDKPGTVGFSWGFGLRVSKFHLSYGRATYHQAGASNHFSVTTRLPDFRAKK
jgi:hypothetical protein